MDPRLHAGKPLRGAWRGPLAGSAATLGAALQLALLAAPSAGAIASQANVYESVTTGTLSRSPGTNLQLQLSAHARPRGVRRVPQLPSAEAPVRSLPVASPAPISSAQAPLLANFDGVSNRDNVATNFGEQIEPPDQGLCVGNGFVVEMVNSAYTVYRPDGTVVSGPFNVNAPFNLGLTEYTSDPRCYYDAATNTWFATTLFINRGETASAVEIAVNSSGDPTTAWTDYQLETTDIGGSTGPSHPGCPCEGDQPTLGIDSHNLYVTTNEFPIEEEEFKGAQIYAISKKDLVSLRPAVHFVHFDGLSIGGALATSVQPALSSGAPKAEFFLSSLDPTATVDHRVGVWALTRAAAVGRGGTPTLSSLVLASETYGVPPRAEQRGSRRLLESGDDRMQQVQFDGGSVWGELGTALSIVGDAQPRAGAAWFEVKPTLAGRALGGAQIARQGYVSLLGNHLLYPALALTPSGAGAMVMTVSGRQFFPGAAYTTLAPGASAFGPLTVAALGTSHYDRHGVRWGDYSWAIPDPSGSSVWLATEYVPPRSSQTSDGRLNWGTRVLQAAG